MISQTPYKTHIRKRVIRRKTAAPHPDEKQDTSGVYAGHQHRQLPVARPHPANRPAVTGGLTGQKLSDYYRHLPPNQQVWDAVMQSINESREVARLAQDDEPA